MAEERSLYQILNEVNDSRSITEVANKLFLSQPYVSRVIKTAEEKYQTRLIKRKPLPIELTTSGQVLKNDLQNLLAANNRITLDMAPFSKTSGPTVKLAFHQPLETAMISPILQRLTKKFPLISFDVNEVTANLAQRKLQTHEIDIFVGEVFNSPAIISKPTYIEKLYFIVPKNNPLFKNKVKKYRLKHSDLQRFNNQSFINLRDDSFFQQMINNMFFDKGIRIKSKIKVSNTIAASKLANDGLGITISTYDLIKKLVPLTNVNLVEIPLDILHLDIATSYMRDSNNLIKRIAKFLRQSLQEIRRNDSN